MGGHSKAQQQPGQPSKNSREEQQKPEDLDQSRVEPGTIFSLYLRRCRSLTLNSSFWPCMALYAQFCLVLIQAISPCRVMHGLALPCLPQKTL